MIMASSDLAITDIFPMRKKRTNGLSKQKTTTSTKAQQEKNREKSIASASKKTPGKPAQPSPGKKQPLKTPTRHQCHAIGRLRRTPRRIAEWGHGIDNDSGPEITWDNNSPSPTKTLQKRSNRFVDRGNPGDISALIKKLSNGKKCPPVNNETSMLFNVWMKREDDVTNGTNANASKKLGLRKRHMIEKAGDKQSRPLQRTTRKRFHNTTSNGMKFHEELSKFIQNINVERCSPVESDKDSFKVDDCQQKETRPVAEVAMDFEEDDFFIDDDDHALVEVIGENFLRDQRPVPNCRKENVRTDLKAVTNDKNVVTKKEPFVTNDNDIARTSKELDKKVVNCAKTDSKNVTNYKQAVASDNIMTTAEMEVVLKDQKVVTNKNIMSAGENDYLDCLDDCDDIIGQLDDDYDDDIISFKMEEIPMNIIDEVQELKKDSSSKTMNDNEIKNDAKLKACGGKTEDEYGGDSFLDLDCDDLDVYCSSKIMSPKADIRMNRMNDININATQIHKKTVPNHPSSAENDFKLIDDDLLINDDDLLINDDDLLINDDDFDLIDVDDVDTAVPQRNKNNDSIDYVCDMAGDFPEDNFCIDDVIDIPLINADHKPDTGQKPDTGHKPKAVQEPTFAKPNAPILQKTMKRPAESSSKLCVPHIRTDPAAKASVGKPEMNPQLKPAKQVGNLTNSAETKTFIFRNIGSSATTNANAIKNRLSKVSNSTEEDRNVQEYGNHKLQQAHAVVDKVNSGVKKCTNKSGIPSGNNKVAGSMQHGMLDISVIPRDDDSAVAYMDVASCNDLFGNEDSSHQNADTTPMTSTQKYSNQDIERKRAEAKKKLQLNLIKQKQQKAALILQRNRLKAMSKTEQK